MEYIHGLDELADPSVAYDTVGKRLLRWNTAGALGVFAGLGILTLVIGHRLLDPVLGWPRRVPATDAERHELGAHDRKTFNYLSVIYGILALVMVLLFIFVPVYVGQLLRPATVIALFLPFLIATLAALSWFSLSWRMPLVPIAFAAWFGLGFRFDNHFVRPFEPDNTAAPSRETVEEAFDKWYQAAKNRHCSGSCADKEVPIVFVATAGGGIRAAYWTATVLGALQDDHSEFAQDLFAISSVSGGSLGATVFRALLARSEGLKRSEALCETPKKEKSNSFAECGQQVLDQDGLGPMLGVMLFPDLLRRLTPFPLPYRERDRARALETSWEDGWERTTGSTLFSESFDALWQDKNKPYPALFLNGTSVKSGRRIITSNLRLNGNTGSSFPDALDFFDQSHMSIRVSTAINNSARFPVIDPAGTFRVGKQEADQKHQVVDGGYFENYGATTALNLVDAIRRHYDGKYKDKNGKLKDGELGLRFTFVQISSDPTLPEEDEDNIFAAGAIASELSAPVWALTATRTARGVYEAALAKQRLQRDFGKDCKKGKKEEAGCYLHLRLEVGYGHAAPLGWVLSESAKETLQDIMKCDRQDTQSGNNCANKNQFVAALKHNSTIARDEGEKSRRLRRSADLGGRAREVSAAMAPPATATRARLCSPTPAAVDG